jgi:hypothetical protein
MQVAWRVLRLTLETAETLVQPLGMRSPIRMVAACCCVILLAAPTWACASSSRTTGSTSGPLLVWSIEDAFGSGTQKYTLVIGNVNGSPTRILHEGRAPQISPNGRWVAYSHDEHAYVLPRTGGRPWLRCSHGVLTRRGSPRETLSESTWMDAERHS